MKHLENITIDKANWLIIELAMFIVGGFVLGFMVGYAIP